MDTFPHAMDPGTPADKIVQVDPAVPTPKAPVQVAAKASKKAAPAAPAASTTPEG